MHRAESFLPALGLPFEVPAGMSPALAGVLVGAVSGIVLFTLVMIATRRRPTAPFRTAVAYEVMHVAPYATGSGRVLPSPSSFPPPPPPAPPLSPVLYDPLARAGQHEAAAPVVDDSPTVIAETLFDEPPQPRHRRSTPPRIRPIAPTPPRFGGDHP